MSPKGPGEVYLIGRAVNGISVAESQGAQCYKLSRILDTSSTQEKQSEHSRITLEHGVLRHESACALLIDTSPLLAIANYLSDLHPAEKFALP